MTINWPLIRYAGSAAETSVGSKPIGSELIWSLSLVAFLSSHLGYGPSGPVRLIWLWLLRQNPRSHL